MFALTPAAAEQIARAAAEEPKAGNQPMLRVAAKIDEADGELVYGMGFDDEREDDLVVDGGGIAILISPHSQPAAAAHRLRCGTPPRPLAGRLLIGSLRSAITSSSEHVATLIKHQVAQLS